MVAMTSAPGLRRGDFLRGRPANLQHHVGAERFIRRDKPRASRLIVGVGEPGLVARAILDGDICPKGGEFLDRFRAGCDARFPLIRLRRRCYQHEPIPKTVDVGRNERSFRFVSPAESGSRSRAGGTALEHRPSGRNATAAAGEPRRAHEPARMRAKEREPTGRARSLRRARRPPPGDRWTCRALRASRT